MRFYPHRVYSLTGGRVRMEYAGAGIWDVHLEVEARVSLRMVRQVAMLVGYANRFRVPIRAVIPDKCKQIQRLAVRVGLRRCWPRMLAADGVVCIYENLCD